MRTYLRAVGVLAIPRSDSLLWNLLDPPLLLTIVALAYAGQPLDSLAIADPITARDRLFDAYIERMFQRNSRNAPYARPQVMRWLAWLAQEMTAQNLEVFKP